MAELTDLKKNLFSGDYKVVALAESDDGLDEEGPIDMSLKSRKRSPGPDTTPKKKRASVISYATVTMYESGEESNDSALNFQIDDAAEKEIINNLLHERTLDVEVKAPLSKAPQKLLMDQTVDGALEEHFRRSLCKDYCAADDEGVDAHFSKSLGSETWKEIKKTHVIPPPPESDKKSIRCKPTKALQKPKQGSNWDTTKEVDGE